MRLMGMSGLGRPRSADRNKLALMLKSGNMQLILWSVLYRRWSAHQATASASLESAWVTFQH
jgi:hypothetical protein